MTSPALPAAGVLATAGTALSFLGVFADRGWLLPALITIAAVTGTAEIVRRLPVPAALAPLAGLAALVAVLTATFAPQEAVARVAPTPAVVAELVALVQSGWQDILAYAAPVPSTPGILFLLVCGIGLVAILVDTLASTHWSAALTGIPLLLLYTVPALYAPGGAAAVGFALGAAGYLLMLHLERSSRLRAWGRRHEPARGGTRGHLSMPGAAAGIALPVLLGLLIPMVVPGLSSALVRPGSSDGFGNSRTVQVNNPILNLRDDLRRRDSRPLLTYRTDSTERPYIRLVGLDSFNGERWDTSRLQVPQRQRVDRGMDAPRLGADVARTAVRTEMSVKNLQSQWLPLPYPATRVAIEGTWLYDKDTFNVFTYERPTTNQSYVVEHLDLRPTAEQLNASDARVDGLERFLELPPDLDPIIARTAEEQIRRRGAQTPYQKAVALRDWLRTFQYDERAPDGTGESTLVSFLDKRRGFCVHFASTLAVMARQLGIPARVGVGFLPGHRDESGDWVVTARDAHAWPELYFSGVGWVAFEPTPPQRTEGAGTPGFPAPQPDEGSTATPGRSASPTPVPPVGSSDGGNAQDGTSANDPPDEDGKKDEDDKDEDESSLLHRLRWWLLGAGAVLTLAFTPALLAAVQRRRRWSVARNGSADGGRALGNAAIAQLRADCLDYGVPWRPQHTPRQALAGLSSRLDDAQAQASLQRLFRLAEQLEYAPRLEPVDGIEGDCRSVRQALDRTAPRGKRWAARLWPASLWSAGGAAAPATPQLTSRSADVALN